MERHDMEKLTWITIAVCAALVACEPRGTPPKPETTPAQLSVVDRAASINPLAPGRD
jgi:hypothetical protein